MYTFYIGVMCECVDVDTHSMYMYIGIIWMMVQSVIYSRMMIVIYGDTNFKKLMLLIPRAIPHKLENGKN